MTNARNHAEPAPGVDGRSAAPAAELAPNPVPRPQLWADVETRVAAFREGLRALDAGDWAAAMRAMPVELFDDDPVATAIVAAARALRHARRGDVDAADRATFDLQSLGVSLSPLLAVLGRQRLRQQRWRDAHAAFALLNLSRPGAIFEFWNALPPDAMRHYAPAAISRLVHARPPRLYSIQPAKRAMVQAWGEAGAAVVLAPMLRPGAEMHVRDLPLVGLLDYARAHALRLRELVAPRDVFLRPPILHGQPPLPALAGRSRSVSLCVLPDIVVTGKSNRLIARDAVLLDFQDGEPERTVHIHDADPLVLASRPGRTTVLDVAEGNRRRPLQAGFPLVGIHSWSHGPWVLEFLSQLWACRDEPGFAQVPLIIDEQMPRQLREALSFFVGADHPLVVLRAGESVRVAELWTCTKIACWPGDDRPDHLPMRVTEPADTAALASLVRGLEPLLAKVAPAAAPSRRIYVARKPGQKPDLANREAVEQWFVAQGFEKVDFDDLSFVEQVRKLRDAEIVVGPDNAAFHGLLFARPGTRLGALAQEALDGYEWWGQLFRDLGHHLLVLPGQAPPNPASRAQADRVVDLAGLPGFLAALETLEDTRERGGASEAEAGVVHVPGDEPVPAPPAAEPPAEHLQRDIAAISNAAMDLGKGWFVDLGENDAAGAAGPVGRALVQAATIELTYSRRDDEAALAILAEVEHLGVPLAQLLRHVGRHAVARGDDDAAFEYHSLLDALQPGGLWTYLRNTTGLARLRFAPAALDQCLRAARPLFYDMQQVKAALATEIGIAGAAMQLAEAIHPRAPWRLRRLPLAGLLAHAREHGLALDEVIAPRDVQMAPPDVFGRKRERGFAGRSRSVSACVLADATVWGKSNLLRAGDRVLLDHQGTELERIPLNLDTHPLVVAASDGHVVFVEHDAPVRLPDLRVAMSLAGLHSYDFGHWIFEHMFPLWACMDRPGFAEVTLLVDAQMPAQHRELLEFCVGRDHPVVVLGAGQSVRVETLWACSKIAYWPGGEKMPAASVHDYELSDVAAVAGLVRKLEPRLARLEVAGLPERIYLTRHVAQERAPDDPPTIESILAGRGFAVLDFATMPMQQQLRHLRAARTVVLEAGSSSLYAALFCRAGTRIGALCDADPTGNEWCAEMFRALGMHLLLLPGAPVAESTGREGAEGAGIDLDQLDAFLQALESGPSRA